MQMKTLFEKTKNWWLKLPWYWKILGCLVLLLLALLWVLSLVGGTSTSRKNLTVVDKLHARNVDTDLEKLEDETKVLKNTIIKKKKEIAFKLNQAATINATTLKRREALNNAKTMEELDKLQEEFDL